LSKEVRLLLSDLALIVMTPSLKIAGFIAESLTKIGVFIGELFDVI
jgi:hypothetical protein